MGDKVAEVIKFKNGSSITTLYVSSSNHRGKRSKVISFWCDNCKKIHEEVPMSEMMRIGENTTICKTSYDEVIKPYMNIE